MPTDCLALLAREACDPGSQGTVKLDSFWLATIFKALHREHTETHSQSFHEKGLFPCLGNLACEQTSSLTHIWRPMKVFWGNGGHYVQSVHLPSAILRSLYLYLKPNFLWLTPGHTSKSSGSGLVVTQDYMYLHNLKTLSYGLASNQPQSRFYLRPSPLGHWHVLVHHKLLGATKYKKVWEKTNS